MFLEKVIHNQKWTRIQDLGIITKRQYNLQQTNKFLRYMTKTRYQGEKYSKCKKILKGT